MRNRITFPDFASFMNGCAALVPHGVTFEADANTLTIILTGGY
jgi:hypothetical protein